MFQAGSGRKYLVRRSIFARPLLRDPHEPLFVADNDRPEPSLLPDPQPLGHGPIAVDDDPLERKDIEQEAVAFGNAFVRTEVVPGFLRHAVPEQFHEPGEPAVIGHASAIAINADRAAGGRPCRAQW
ncbi:MAG TPA: hypothetical protein VH331_10150 [Allosphingosinicella sp.]|nr:hypothetical protein [Allosphingosinicella sp.]